MNFLQLPQVGNPSSHQVATHIQSENSPYDSFRKNQYWLFFLLLCILYFKIRTQNLGILLSVVAELLWLLFSILTNCCMKYQEWICIQKWTTTMLRLMFFYSLYSQIPQQEEAPRAPCREAAGNTQAWQTVYPWLRHQWLQISKVFS